MDRVKLLLLGIVIGVGIGMWFGVNIGRDRSIFSNPFVEDTLQDKIKQTGDKLLEKSGEVLKKGGQKLEQGGQALEQKFKKDN